MGEPNCYSVCYSDFSLPLFHPVALNGSIHSASSTLSGKEMQNKTQRFVCAPCLSYEKVWRVFTDLSRRKFFFVNVGFYVIPKGDFTLKMMRCLPKRQLHF